MKILFVLFVLFVIAVQSQLILDEDDPETKVLIDMIMKAINEHDHSNYKFKTIIYSLGESDIFKIMLKVTDDQGVVKNCALNLHDHGDGFFKPENIDCVHANQ